jgi:hypothetical protein
LSSVVRRGNPCQPLTTYQCANEARAGGSEPARERRQAPSQGKRRKTDQQNGSDSQNAGTKKYARYYQLHRSRKFTRTSAANDLESWVDVAKEIFSAPSKGPGGEKASAFVLDKQPPQTSRASRVPEPPPLPGASNERGAVGGPARGVPGVDAASVERGCTTLLDYRLTQGEKKKGSFYKSWRGYVPSTVDTYQQRAVIAGHVIKLYKYHTPQVCQRGKTCKKRMKREDRTEKDKQSDRRKNLFRARYGFMDTINANVGRPWGELLKFFTMSFKNDIFNLKQANRQFNKFIKRLEYHIERKVHYTVIARFQDGKRPGGKAGGRDGVIHYHVLFYDLPYVPHEKLTAIWGQGFVWINAVGDVDNVGVYMVEGYMGKEMDDKRLNGQKHYWSSRGLMKPEVMYGTKDLRKSLGIEDREPVYRSTFTSDYVGVVDYEQYNLKREGKVYARKKKSASTGVSRPSTNDNGSSGTGLDMVLPLRKGVSPGGSAVGR